MDDRFFFDAREVMKMIELQPAGSHDERDLVHLVSFHGGRLPSYSFEQYLEHAKAFGMHGVFHAIRAKLLDEVRSPRPVQ